MIRKPAVLLAMLATAAASLIVSSPPASADQSASGDTYCYHGRRVGVEDKASGVVSVTAVDVNKIYVAPFLAVHRTQSSKFSGSWTVNAVDAGGPGIIVHAFGYCYF
ncbi:hypothetical protein [Streptomyces sp. NPDC058665]|uniref:hypothetical protein n=1 Tax=Streptomyces sp. NPDC058665 TaxID=3346586 RepID=UPI00365D01AC